MESHVTFENVITLIQHEHPLHLVDLQPCYPDYREFSDDEEEDKVIIWDFKSPCSQCGKDINVYYRSMRKPCVAEDTYYGIGQAPHEVDLRSCREP
nr:B-box-type zinc finger, zinc finger, PHD-type, DC1 [Tanacetum cinerariifolium]